MRRLLILSLFPAIWLAACTARPPAERISLPSSDVTLTTELTDGAPDRRSEAIGYLMIPAAASVEAPAAGVVLLHSSNGPDSQLWFYMKMLGDAGYAVLAVDSFSPRGVKNTMEDQTQVTEATMMADAYAAFGHLDRHPRIDGARIAVLGFSKGAMPALYSALVRYRDALSGERAGFAAHVAFYPWCGMQVMDAQMTGAPVMVQIGARDRSTPAQLCEELTARWRAQNPGVTIALTVHPNARHAFEHPTLGRWPLGLLPVDKPVPRNCRFEEVAADRFVERASGLEITADNLAEAVAACSEIGSEVAFDRDAADAARAAVLAFLDRHLGRESQGRLAP